MEEFKRITNHFQLQIRGIHGEHSESEDNIFDVSNKRRLGISEVELVQNMYNGVKALIRREKEIAAEKNPPKSFFDFTARKLDSDDRVSMKDLAGDAKAILVVNTASKDDQAAKVFTNLKQLHGMYAENGLRILAFPSDSFSTTFTWYEFTFESSIKEFANEAGAEFPILGKVQLSGKSAHPLFKWLQKESGKTIDHNFGKFLLDGNGKIIQYLNSETQVWAFMSDIYVLLSDPISDEL